MKQVIDTSESSQLALICTGSNVNSAWGNPVETTVQCFDRLESKLSVRIARSALYETPAFPSRVRSQFRECSWLLLHEPSTTHEILEILHSVEKEADRIREKRWAPRTLDIDLIAFGDAVLPEPSVWQKWVDMTSDRQRAEAPEELILPHPRVQDRAFALVPLCDVAADWVHPVFGRSLGSLKHDCALDELRAVQELV